jgi:hypothetical protein
MHEKSLILSQPQPREGKERFQSSNIFPHHNQVPNPSRNGRVCVE